MGRRDRGPGEATPGPRVEPILMVTERQCYLAYMLRLWQVGEDAKVWRASLENAHTGAHHGFAGLNGLFLFLEDETGQNLSAAEAFLGSGEGHRQESEPQSSEGAGRLKQVLADPLPKSTSSGQ